MNAMFAAGLFDSPWVVLAILIGSAVANWLAKRRQEKQAGQPDRQPEGAEPVPPTGPAPGEFNLEETLRRLMGEETPPPSPAPPVIPRSARSEVPPIRGWSEAGLPPREPAQPMVNRPLPVLRPSVIVPPLDFPSPAENKEIESAEQRFEQLTEQVKRPATVVTHKLRPAVRRRRRGAAPWREARSVRRAFVASLVFAPPKSIEPRPQARPGPSAL